MKNVTDKLTLEYWILLKDAVAVPVFRDKVIEDVALGADGYLLVYGVNNTGDSTKQSHETQTSVNVGVFTRATSTNDGSLLETLTDAIYETIMPNNTPVISITGFQVRLTDLANENSSEPFISDQQTFLNRTITFKHMIFHN